MDKLSLKNTIAALRRELAESILAAKDESIRFEVGAIDLEFAVEIEQNLETSGGVSFWIVEADAKAGKTSTRTHRISMNLRPVSHDGRPILTGTTQVIPD